MTANAAVLPPWKPLQRGIDAPALHSSRTAASDATPSDRATRRAIPDSTAHVTPPHLQAIADHHRWLWHLSLSLLTFAASCHETCAPSTRVLPLALRVLNPASRTPAPLPLACATATAMTCRHRRRPQQGTSCWGTDPGARVLDPAARDGAATMAMEERDTSGGGEEQDLPPPPAPA